MARPVDPRNPAEAGVTIDFESMQADLEAAAASGRLPSTVINVDLVNPSPRLKAILQSPEFAAELSGAISEGVRPGPNPTRQA